mgnify:CR=1 FL=1
MARSVHLMWGRTDGVLLTDIVWSPASLKREIVMMLQRAGLAPTDMIRAWDHTADGSFSRREFMVRAALFEFHVVAQHEPTIVELTRICCLVLCHGHVLR